MTDFEKKLDYEFRDGALLARALMSPSVRQSNPTAPDNQRLEFLGDSVLGLLAANALFAAFPDEQEGPLTVRRTHLVSGRALAEVAERIGLRDVLKRGIGAPPLAPNAKPLADALEAVMGAVWLDGGIAAAQHVFDALNLPVTEDFDERQANPRMIVQKTAQALRPPRKPTYEVLKVTGPDHRPVVTVRVTVPTLGAATATAVTKAAAEVEAARLLLDQIENAHKA